MIKLWLFTCAGLVLALGAAYAQGQPQPDLIVDP